MMEDEIRNLLQLGDLVPLQDTSTESCDFSTGGQSTLSAEDVALIKEIPTTQLQEWCLARITEHRARIRRLRETYGPVARSAVWEVKSHIRALRSEYNACAPINYHLPPEVLTEIFTNIHPAMTPYLHTPVLRVCRYWRSLILKTPRFWANILSLRHLYSGRLEWFRSRFIAALALSAPLGLTLSILDWSMDVIDDLLPHSSRIASLTLYFNSYSKPSQRLFEQPLSQLKDLAIFYPFGSNPVYHLRLCFHLYPNIRSLRLRLARFYSPFVPCISLRHLDLTQCKIHTRGTPGYFPSMSSLYDALELFPNLETLYLSKCLSEHRRYPNDPSELTKIVHLPHLRRVDIQDNLTYISPFLSHISIPPTTNLVLHLDCYNPGTFGRPVRAPESPSIHLSHGAPDAEISLHLDFWYHSSRHRALDCGLARPEERAARDLLEGAGMVRITLSSICDPIDPLMHFTRGLARAFAPSLSSGGVTNLAVRGTYAPSSGREFWTAVLPDLPGLRRIVCEDVLSTQVLVEVLGAQSLVEPGSRDTDSFGSGFPSPGLTQLVLVWNLPDVHELESSMEEQDCRTDSVGTSEAEDVEFLCCEVVAALDALCDALRGCLTARRAARRCQPIRKLSVALRNSDGKRVLLMEWEAELAERHLKERLGADLVEEIVVVDNVQVRIEDE